MAGSGDSAVSIRGLRKRYGKRIALDGLDLDVPRGCVYGFLGPNGSGKTTTLRVLVGLIRPDAGAVEVLGTPYAWGDRRRLFRIGSLIETPAFYPYLSGRENLAVFAAAGPPTPRTRIGEVLDAVGLGERAGDKVKTYSLGMRQRLGIAVALLSEPDLLLLDEPANGLDPAGIVAMRELLRSLTATGTSVVVSSHILSEVQMLADTVGIIDHGRLVREGPLRAVLAGSERLIVRVPPGDAARAAAILATIGELIPPPAGLQADDRIEIRLPADRGPQVTRALGEQGIWLAGLEVAEDLESVFLALTAPGSATPAGGWRMPPPGDHA